MIDRHDGSPTCSGVTRVAIIAGRNMSGRLTFCARPIVTIDTCANDLSVVNLDHRLPSSLRVARVADIRCIRMGCRLTR